VSSRELSKRDGVWVFLFDGLHKVFIPRTIPWCLGFVKRTKIGFPAMVSVNLQIIDR
jgi:hypothetical protein